MRAVLYTEFAQRPTLENLPDPAPSPGGVVVRVHANGLCRSDWHGWMGHDPDITLPHVPGHELAGVIEATGKDVSRWKIGDQVTVPFVGGCGTCPQCASGNHQVCDHQFQPGFTHWGSFAEFVVVDQGRVTAGQWVAVHGCGGVGLSAIMIASALGTRVVAVDINDEKLNFARSVGGTATVHGANSLDVVDEVREISAGGVHVSIDALGHPATCFDSIANLRKRGRHIQIGLMVGDHKHPAVPMDQVLANELEIVGSHGMQAYRYPEMLAMIKAGQLRPERLIGRTVSLVESIDILVGMDRFSETGVTVINKF